MWQTAVLAVLSAYPSPAPENSPTTSVVGSARSCSSMNFRIESYSPSCDARMMADRCESWRQHLQTKWLGTGTDGNWSPCCVVVIHARRETYRAAIGGGGEQSFGSSWINSRGGRISQRRIDLLIDRQGAVPALGHELTHLVLADAFPGSRPPAWANEGAAVLADSAEKQQLHKRDLDQSFPQRTAFHCADLIHLTDYPSPNRIAAFYGQSASLAAFLAQVGGSEKFVPFLKQASDHGYDHALRQSYGIDGLAELQRR